MIYTFHFIFLNISKQQNKYLKEQYSQHITSKDDSSDDSIQQSQYDSGFSSKFDPDFSKMTTKELQDYIKLRNYKPGSQTNEVYNVYSHAISSVIFIYGVIVLMVKSNTIWKKLSFILYGLCTLVMLGGSACYHQFGIRSCKSIETYRKWRMVDHLGIFFCISGTITPYALNIIQGSLGISVSVLVFYVLFIGVILKLIVRHSINQQVFNAMYLLLGWTGLLLIKPLYQRTGLGGLLYVFSGGLAYTIGIIFFQKEKPNPIPGYFCSHEIWHTFVSLGVLLHYIPNLKYVIYL